MLKLHDDPPGYFDNFFRKLIWNAENLIWRAYPSLLKLQLHNKKDVSFGLSLFVFIQPEYWCPVVRGNNESHTFLAPEHTVDSNFGCVEQGVLYTCENQNGL